MKTACQTIYSIFYVIFILFIVVGVVQCTLYLANEESPRDYDIINTGTVIKSGCVSRPFKSGYVHDCRVDIQWDTGEIYRHTVSFSTLEGDRVDYRCKETNRFALSSDTKYEACGVGMPRAGDWMYPLTGHKCDNCLWVNDL